MQSRFDDRKRSRSHQALVRRFGKAALIRFPGMGEFLAVSLFGRRKQEKKIQWSVNEILRLSLDNTTLGVDLISGDRDSSGWPIQPVYDYIFSIDRVVFAMLAEGVRVKLVNLFESVTVKQMDRRIPAPDFRTGERVAFDVDIKSTQFGVITQLGEQLLNGQQKTQARKMTEDGAILSFPHFHDIIALSQGLFRTYFTDDTKADEWVNTLSEDVRDPLLMASISNPLHLVMGAAVDAEVVADFHAMGFEDDLEPRVRDGTEFQFVNGDVGVVDRSTMVHGGAFGVFAFRVDRLGTIAYRPDATVRHTAARQLDHAIRFIDVFSSINELEGISRSLLRTHMKLQHDYDKVRRKYVRLSDAETIFHMAEPAPKSATRIFLDREGKMVPEFVKTSAGKIRTPAIDGPSVVAAIVSK